MPSSGTNFSAVCRLLVQKLWILLLIIPKKDHFYNFFKDIAITLTNTVVLYLNLVLYGQKALIYSGNIADKDDLAYFGIPIIHGSVAFKLGIFWNLKTFRDTWQDERGTESTAPRPGVSQCLHQRRPQHVRDHQEEGLPPHGSRLPYRDPRALHQECWDPLVHPGLLLQEV